MTNDCKKLMDIVTTMEFLFPEYNLAPGFEVKIDLIYNFHARALKADMNYGAIVSMIEIHCEKNVQ